MRLSPATGLRTGRLVAHINHRPFPPSTIYLLAHRQIATPSQLPFCTRRRVSSSEAIPHVPILIELLHSVRGSQSLRSATSRRRTDKITARSHPLDQHSWRENCSRNYGSFHFLERRLCYICLTHTEMWSLQLTSLPGSTNLRHSQTVRSSAAHTISTFTKQSLAASPSTS